MPITWQVHTLERAASTQSILKEAASGGAAQGYCVRAVTQDSGVGRHGRVWARGEGNLYVSFLLKPEVHAMALGQISLMIGLSLYQALQLFIDKQKAGMVLKWPNDILLVDRKCAGILIESELNQDGTIAWLVVGIGVNIKTAPIDTSSSLQDYAYKPIDAEGILRHILEMVDKNYDKWKNEGFSEIRDEWLARSYSKGTNLIVKPDNKHISGQFDTIDMDGNLILKMNETGEIKMISAGDVFPIMNDKKG